MLALERKGVGVSAVSSVLYESIDVLEPFETSELSVPAVNGLGSDGSLLCLCRVLMSNGDSRLNFFCKASCRE